MDDKFQVTYRRTLDHLRKLCSSREYCIRDIRDKALKRLLPAGEGRDIEADTDLIVGTLQKEGYLDQNRFAAAFARDKAGISGWGPLKIRSALSMKGVDRETIAEALSSIDAEKAHDRLFKALEAKSKSLKDDPQKRIKLLKFGLSRGYDYEPVSKALSEILENDE